MIDANPYQSPESSDPAAPVPEIPLPRPVSPMVLGIISIIFGALGVLCTPFNFVTIQMQPDVYDKMGLSLTFAYVSIILGIAMSFVLLAAGIGLVRYRRWGRLLFMAHAIVTILWSIPQSVYMMNRALTAEFDDPSIQAGLVAGAIGGLIGLILPVVGLIFLNLSRVRDSLE